MAKKQGGKAASADKKSRKAAKADAKALKADGKAAKLPGLSGKDAKSKALAAPTPVEATGKAGGRKVKSIAATVSDASSPKAVRGKSLKTVKASALGLLPSAPSPAPTRPDTDPRAAARELGSRIVALMSEPSGRTFAAELLTAVASALTEAPSGQGAAGPDATGTAVKRRGRRSSADASSAPPA